MELILSTLYAKPRAGTSLGPPKDLISSSYRPPPPKEVSGLERVANSKIMPV